MKESNEAQLLMSMLVEENKLIHRECARALSWIKPSINAPKPISEEKTFNQSPLPLNPSQPSYYSKAEPVLLEDLESWLNNRLVPPSNWFIMNSDIHEDYINLLEQDVQITSKSVVSQVPGAYEITGLWRRRPGIRLNLFYPPNFKPENSFATVAVEISQGDVNVFYEMPVENFIISLNKLIQKVITEFN